jgi:hypothetical protein
MTGALHTTNLSPASSTGTTWIHNHVSRDGLVEVPRHIYNDMSVDVYNRMDIGNHPRNVAISNTVAGWTYDRRTIHCTVTSTMRDNRSTPCSPVVGMSRMNDTKTNALFMPTLNYSVSTNPSTCAISSATCVTADSWYQQEEQHEDNQEHYCPTCEAPKHSSIVH